MQWTDYLRLTHNSLAVLVSFSLCSSLASQQQTVLAASQYTLQESLSQSYFTYLSILARIGRFAAEKKIIFLYFILYSCLAADPAGKGLS